MDNYQEERRVARAIKAALKLIAEHDPELAQLLRETISTDEYLSYTPGSQPSLRRSQAPKKTRPRQGKNPVNQAEDKA